MSWTVAVDPGKAKSASAWGKGDHIEHLIWIISGERSQVPPVERFFIEKPMIYPGPQNADPNDQMDLCEVVGWIRREIHGFDVEKVWYPREWKAQVKKPIHHGRIWEHLTKAEKALFPPNTPDRIESALERSVKNPKLDPYKKWEWHNMLDSAALYLFGVGRVGLGGVKRRK